eukprot:Blabericola_migrator_1__6028@NODE_3039_length_2092_cov_231_218272_g1898_i0_p1_GENE_NODE_3039_length_2092_cov_231_218272_g1898_i0NODE_3039_length_2092_cov_231_218272_g1898_i0_p1_ORF_typecomplete_len248_score25_13_NODE_3039_length_2092_cov_231_218272_g1898_i0124867
MKEMMDLRSVNSQIPTFVRADPAAIVVTNQPRPPYIRDLESHQLTTTTEPPRVELTARTYNSGPSVKPPVFSAQETSSRRSIRRPSSPQATVTSSHARPPMQSVQSVMATSTFLTSPQMPIISAVSPQHTLATSHYPLRYTEMPGGGMAMAFTTYSAQPNRQVAYVSGNVIPREQWPVVGREVNPLADMISTAQPITVPPQSALVLARAGSSSSSSSSGSSSSLGPTNGYTSTHYTDKKPRRRICGC